MPSGGPRSGQPGRAYRNRTDLNTAAPSQQYGSRVAQERSMAAVPVGPPPRPALTVVPDDGSGAPTPTPTPVTDLFAPTSRPGEPVTSGAALGPGAGPSALPDASNAVATRLRAIYQILPSEELRELLEDLEDELG